MHRMNNKKMITAQQVEIIHHYKNTKKYCLQQMQQYGLM